MSREGMLLFLVDQGLNYEKLSKYSNEALEALVQCYTQAA